MGRAACGTGGTVATRRGRIDCRARQDTRRRLSDRRTARAYDRGSETWIAQRAPDAVRDGRLAAFLRKVPRAGLIADLGCGPGWYAAEIEQRGRRAVAIDLVRPMLRASRRRSALPAVQGDLAALPLRRGSLDGAWAANCYCHVPRGDLALALADLHAALQPDAPIELTLPRLEHWNPTKLESARGEGERRSKKGELPGRLFTAVSPARAQVLLIGAGFAAVRVRPLPPDEFWLVINARRARTLSDLVRPKLRLLICGLNPSVYSADVGISFARPGNRFWPAAVKAGLVDRPRDMHAALGRGIGFTDLVKRATPGAAELSPSEYAAGIDRVAALVALYRPGAVCFVGLDGWRAAVDRRAQPGWIPSGFGGRPAYLMPSTSGRNARVSVDQLAAHMREAARGPRATASMRR